MQVNAHNNYYRAYWTESKFPCERASVQVDSNMSYNAPQDDSELAEIAGWNIFKLVKQNDASGRAMGALATLLRSEFG